MRRVELGGKTNRFGGAAGRGKGAVQQGWGVPFADYFDSTKVNIANHSRGGRSSRTSVTSALSVRR
jgi:hypothetical protein